MTDLDLDRWADADDIPGLSGFSEQAVDDDVLPGFEQPAADPTSTGTVEDIPFAPELPFVVARLSLRNLSTYDVRQVVWLDKPFLQRGAFHLLGGRKGVCKGTWLCGMAARVTTGDLYGEPMRVLVITSEDSSSSTSCRA